MHKTVQEKLAAAVLVEAYYGEWSSLSEQDQKDFLTLVELFAAVLQSPSIRDALTQAHLIEGLVSALLTPDYRSRWAQRT